MTQIAPFPFGITVMVRRPTGPPNRYGDVTYADHHTIEGCGLAPRYATEVNENRTSSIIGFSLFGPPDSDLKDIDRIVAPHPGGQEYRVEGQVAEWDNPMTGWRPGFEAALVRIT